MTGNLPRIWSVVISEMSDKRKEKRVPRSSYGDESRHLLPLTLMLLFFFLKLYLSVFIYADLDTERISNG